MRKVESALAVFVFHDETGAVILDRLGRREAAGGHLGVESRSTFLVESKQQHSRKRFRAEHAFYYVTFFGAPVRCSDDDKTILDLEASSEVLAVVVLDYDLLADFNPPQDRRRSCYPDTVS